MRSDLILEALSSRTFSISMEDKLAPIIQTVNYVKLFTKLCKDRNSNHETLLFHKSIRWLFKVDMIACVFKMKNYLLFFEAFVFAGKNINCINNYDAIDAFMAKLRLGIVEFKKEMQQKKGKEIKALYCPWEKPN